MKGTPVAMRAELGRSLASVAKCWKLTKNDQLGDEVLTLTEHDKAIPDPTDGLLYVPIPGGAQSDIASDTALTAGNLNVVTAQSERNPTLDSIRAGDWDYATIELFFLCWADPSKGRHYLMTGNTGRMSTALAESQTEFRGLLQYLSASIGNLTQPGCRHRLADGGYLMGGCNNDGTINPASFQVTGTLDAVSADGLTLESTAFVELSPPPAGGAGSFAYGWVRIEDESSPNNLRRRDVKLSIDGEVTLQEPFPYTLTPGLTFRAQYGCDGLGDTCRETYDNYVNFSGEEHLPGTDKMVQVGRT